MEKNGTGETRQSAPVCNPCLQACGFLVPPCPHPGQPGLLRPTEPGLGLSPPPPPPQGIFLFLLLKNRASVRINGHPPETSQEKASHLHRPDLRCSDVQEKGEKEEQDSNHLAGRQLRRGSSGGLAAADGIALEALTNCGFPSLTRPSKVLQRSREAKPSGKCSPKLDAR